MAFLLSASCPPLKIAPRFFPAGGKQDIAFYALLSTTTISNTRYQLRLTHNLRNTTRQIKRPRSNRISFFVFTDKHPIRLDLDRPTKLPNGIKTQNILTMHPIGFIKINTTHQLFAALNIRRQARPKVTHKRLEIIQ